jgi:hypothetical protein
MVGKFADRLRIGYCIIDHKFTTNSSSNDIRINSHVQKIREKLPGEKNASFDDTKECDGRIN